MNFLTALVAISIGLGASAEGADGPLDAYRVEFHDRAGKLLAIATVLTDEFKKADRKPNDAACQIELIENKGEGKEIKWFKRLLSEGGVRNVRIETRKAVDSGAGSSHGAARVIIEFSPETSDANIHVVLSLNAKGPEGDWYYAIAAGGFKGGKVLVPRVAATEEMKKLSRSGSTRPRFRGHKP